MRIAIAAPIATADLSARLHGGGHGLPAGYLGAPLTAVLIGELLDQGHEVAAITVDYVFDGPQPARASGPGLSFDVLPGRRHAWRFNGRQPGRILDLFRVERRALCAAILAANVDLVHAHWTGEFALAAQASGVPHVITAHDSARQVLKHTRSPYRAGRALMAHQVLRQAGCVTAVSDYLAHEIARPGGALPLALPNPVAAAVIAAGAARAGASARRIGMVGNGWGSRKNAIPALQAFAQWRGQWPASESAGGAGSRAVGQTAGAAMGLPEGGGASRTASGPAPELHLFGADFGPGERAAAWVARHLSPAGMHFHGMLAHSELMARLARLDLLLHPALEESFGVVLAEAMALGLPVVAGAHSGAVPWVVGDAQWLVDVRSPDAIAAALNEAFTDLDRYAKASQQGRQRVLDHFTPAAVAAQYLAVYQQVLRAAAVPVPLR